MERPLTQLFQTGSEALTLAEYEKKDGYAAVRKALREMSPQDVLDLVHASNLRGRGGAGFPTGAKWCSMPRGPQAPYPKYFVVDADEMEPGTFKDRVLMEGDPHQLIEGIIIGSYAVESDCAYLFIRNEYKLAARRLTKAISEAYAHGYLGKHILGTDFNLDLHVHLSAGRYICGEGSALARALEGKRAIPAPRPPQQTMSGLWGRPTNMNNVETICNVKHIINHGADWFKGLSLCEDGGTKIYGVSGKVKRPGAWELPMGVTIREIIEEHAGGMHDGLRFRGVLPGGASTDFLVEEHLDVPMDFDSVLKAGSRFGTGTMIVLDDRTCPVGMVLNLETFFARESCGWCTPCREGLPLVARILEEIEQGRGQPDHLEVLRAHTRLLGLGKTFCALAPGAMEPLQSALRFFPEDFARHIKDKRCPYR